MPEALEVHEPEATRSYYQEIVRFVSVSLSINKNLTSNKLALIIY